MNTRFFGDSWEFQYELTIEHTYFFGWCKKIIKSNYTISMFQDLKTFHDHWDNLIATKKPLT
jgi:hypothetical protein